MEVERQWLLMEPSRFGRSKEPSNYETYKKADLKNDLSNLPFLYTIGYT